MIKIYPTVSSNCQHSITNDTSVRIDPNQLLFEIFQKITTLLLKKPRDIVSVGLVNRHWNKLTNSICNLFLQENFPDSYGTLEPRSTNLTHYRRLINIENNIENEQYRLQTLPNHEGYINTIIIACNNKIISGAQDCLIKIWDMGAGQELRSLKA